MRVVKRRLSFQPPYPRQPPSPPPSDDDCSKTRLWCVIFWAAAFVTAPKTPTDGDDSQTQWTAFPFQPETCNLLFWAKLV
jgi:hypothetical protein